MPRKYYLYRQSENQKPKEERSKYYNPFSLETDDHEVSFDIENQPTLFVFDNNNKLKLYDSSDIYIYHFDQIIKPESSDIHYTKKGKQYIRIEKFSDITDDITRLIGKQYKEYKVKLDWRKLFKTGEHFYIQNHDGLIYNRSIKIDGHISKIKKTIKLKLFMDERS